MDGSRRFGLSRALHRIGLRLFPASFRRRFGAQMHEDFVGLLSAERSAPRRLRIVARELVDLQRSARRERRDGRCPLYTGGAGGGRLRDRLDDLRVAGRHLAARPAYTAVVVTTLALGTGTGTVIFGIYDAATVKATRYGDPERVVGLFESVLGTRRERGPLSVADYLTWRQGATTLEPVAAYRWDSAVLTGGTVPQRAPSVRVTPNTLGLFDAQPALGRFFNAEDVGQGAAPVVVLHHELWRDVFESDEHVIGKSVAVDDVAHVVVGVMPEGFHYPPFRHDVTIWRPLAFATAEPSDRTRKDLRVLARLTDGNGADAAQAELSAIAAAVAENHPETNEGLGANVVSLQEIYLEGVDSTIRLLAVAALLLQLLTSVNLAGLMLARGMGREREVATRLALGARRGHVVRLLLTEATLVAVMGTAVSLVLAQWGLDIAQTVAPTWPPLFGDLSLNARALLFACALALITTITFSLAPALRATRADLRQAFGGGRSVGGPRDRQRLRGLLVGAQIGAAIVLLMGAGLLLRTALVIVSSDPGIDVRGLATARVWAGEGSGNYYADLVAGALKLPGIERAAVADVVPLSGDADFGPVEIDGTTTPAGGRFLGADIRRVSPEYFETLGLSLVNGRLLSTRDEAGAPRVAVVSEAFAAHFLDGDNPLGRRFKPYDTSFERGKEEVEQVWTIVGMVSDVRSYGYEHPAPPVTYLPHSQVGGDTMNLIVRSSDGRSPPLQPLRELVWGLDGGRAVDRVAPVSDEFVDRYSMQRFMLTLLSAFAVLGALLAAVGLYGVTSYDVRQRSSEIGIRIALGASSRQVLVAVVHQALAVAAAATVVGLLATVPFVRALSTLNGGRLLVGVPWFDPTAMVAVVLLIGAVTLVASAGPALRASRVDPATALRADGA